MRFLAIFSLLVGWASAQTLSPRVEIGVQLSVIDQPALGEKPLAGGGRVTVSLFRFIDAEGEVNRYPIGGAVSNYPATQVLMGTRAGYRVGPIGVYAKVRPGFMRFDATTYSPRLGTRPNLDVGGILEFYSRHHFAMRMDFGDTVIFYGTRGTRHQLQASFGVSSWF